MSNNHTPGRVQVLRTPAGDFPAGGPTHHEEYPYALRFGPDTETGAYTTEYLRKDQLPELIADLAAIDATADAAPVAV